MIELITIYCQRIGSFIHESATSVYELLLIAIEKINEIATAHNTLDEEVDALDVRITANEETIDGQVISVNGEVGVVVLDADDIPETETNTYFLSDERTKLAGVEPLAEVNLIDSVNGEVGVVVLDTGDVAEITDKNYATDAELSKLAGIEPLAEVNLIDSVNGKVGVVVLDADDIAESSTNKYFLSAERSKLTGIEPLAEPNNLTDSQATELTDGGTTELHYHPGGTPSSVDSVNGSVGVVVLTTDDISDTTDDNKFATSAELTKLAGIEALAEVNLIDSVNGEVGVVVLDTGDVAEVTDKNYVTDAELSNIHSPVTVTDTSEINLSLAGQAISADIITGSINESKLDSSVNASLDLADSALQTDDNVTLSIVKADKFVQNASNIDIKTADYTLSLLDSGKTLQLNKATSYTLSIPLNSVVAFPIGTVVEFGMYGVGEITIAPLSTVVIRSGGDFDTISIQYNKASIQKIGTDEWWLVGCDS